MDKATLVKSDMDAWGRVMLALSRARIPLTLYDWNYVPQLDEWQLVIGAPLYDSKGPHEAVSRIVAAMQNENIYQDVPIRRLFVKSPKDPLVKALDHEVSEQTEGVVFIDHSESNGKRMYSVVFAPFSGPGRAVPARRFANEEELSCFLEADLLIPKSRGEEALWELERRGHTWIPNVQLTKREAKRLGLA